MDCKPEGGVEGMSFGALIRSRHFLQHLQCVGLSDPTGGLEGRAGRLTDVCFPSPGSPGQFMNDSLHCQADSLLAWGLGKEGGGWPPPYISRAHTCVRGRGSSRSIDLLGSGHVRWVSLLRGTRMHTTGLWRTSLRFLSRLESTCDDFHSN